LRKTEPPVAPTEPPVTPAAEPSVPLQASLALPEGAA